MGRQLRVQRRVDMVDDKDRRSRMANSSVHAPAKKGGAGGHYTWGNAADVQDFEPKGAGGTQGSKLTTSPQREEPKQQAGGATKAFELESEQHFPTLASGPRSQQQSNGVREALYQQPRSQPGGLLALLHSYDAELKRRPLPTKMWTSFFINMASELLSRRILGTRVHPGDLARQCIIGVGLTVLVDRWYAVLERAFIGWPPEAARTVSVKTALHMAVVEPICAAIFLSAKKLLSGEMDVLASLRESLVKVVVSAWTVWGPTALMQFRFVPTEYRFLVNSVVALFHTMYIIVATSAARPALKK